MTDTTVGFLIGIAIVFVLGLVFALPSRRDGAAGAPAPPPGVHLPTGCYLPVVLAVGAALLGAGFAFRPDGRSRTSSLRSPGLVV